MKRVTDDEDSGGRSFGCDGLDLADICCSVVGNRPQTAVAKPVFCKGRNGNRENFLSTKRLSVLDPAEIEMQV